MKTINNVKISYLYASAISLFTTGGKSMFYVLEFQLSVILKAI